MSTLVYMKMLEQTPAKYDRGMRIITLGRINRIKREIASRLIEPEDDILEIGCGTGSLAAMMSERGARVVGIDISQRMLEEAQRVARDAEFIHMTAVELDGLGKERFDRIVATLCFSELSEEELDCVLTGATKVLKEGGRLVVADEVPPRKWWKRAVFQILRWPLVVLTFVVTQNTTHPLKKFSDRLERAGFRVVSESRYLVGTLSLIVAEKK